MAGIGPGLIDLAALITDEWGNPERDAVVRAYYAVWSQGQHAATPFELFAEDLDFCLLHQAVHSILHERSENKRNFVLARVLRERRSRSFVARSQVT
jgi:hypothetical protein